MTIVDVVSTEVAVARRELPLSLGLWSIVALVALIFIQFYPRAGGKLRIVLSSVVLCASLIPWVVVHFLI